MLEWISFPIIFFFQIDTTIHDFCLLFLKEKKTRNKMLEIQKGTPNNTSVDLKDVKQI